MIISDNGSSAFTLVSADGTSKLSLRMTDLLSGDFREHLTAQGFCVSDDDARSVVSEAVVAVAANPAAWTAVGGIIVTFLRRHRGKVHRFEVENKKISIEGYSARDARKLAADLLKLSRQHGKPE
ncbi:hypothetical protein ACFWY9_23270 [Amycolatopsis sp. NPDC059027]|uniref:hypothetical protein n=1 Tax=unclassified Amycolatopsis TaxID=2618356 RepID=UPI0036705A0A